MNREEFESHCTSGELASYKCRNCGTITNASGYILGSPNCRKCGSRFTDFVKYLDNGADQMEVINEREKKD